MHSYTNIGGFRIEPTGSYVGWKAYLPSGGTWLTITNWIGFNDNVAGRIITNAWMKC